MGKIRVVMGRMNCIEGNNDRRDVYTADDIQCGDVIPAKCIICDIFINHFSIPAQPRIKLIIISPLHSRMMIHL